ncbi:MAG: OmpH family outer membrane protein [Pseudomonadota bacterium]
MGGWLRTVAVLLALTWASATVAQDLRSPILTIDSDRLYRASAFGMRVLEEIESQTRALIEENQTLEQQLEDEERALTEQRADMTPEEFRVLADAFDARVQAIRAEREAKGQEIAAQLEDNRDRFLEAAAPVLEAIMRDAGAAVVLERRSVFISANVIDITEQAIKRINDVLGDGAPVPD